MHDKNSTIEGIRTTTVIISPICFISLIKNEIRPYENPFRNRLSKGAVRATLNGTHQGDLQFRGIPKAIAPTGTEVEFEGTTTCRVANGKIVEVRSIENIAWPQNLAQA